jgi:hypothetical protein
MSALGGSHFSTDFGLPRDVSYAAVRDRNSGLGGQSIFCSARVTLDVNLLRNGNGVVHLDAQIPHCALDLTMPEEQLDGPEIACAPVDERCLGSAQRVGPIETRVKINADEPAG